MPVGEIKNDAVENTENVTNIQLGRYDIWTMNTNTTPPTPPSPKQVASKTAYDTTTENDYIGNFFENSTGTYYETTYNGANFETLGSWIANTIDNKGYYIARYEASYGEGGVALSQTSTGIPAKRGDYTANTEINFAEEFTEGQLWNFVNQPAASTASKAMYTNTTGVEYYSELVNSYAWDTAIIFIQTYSGNTEYSNETSVYVDDDSDGKLQPANTGERGTDVTIGAETTDKVCNIYYMASNCMEWTTEIYASSNYPCVYRGGYFYFTSTTSYRGNHSADVSNYDFAFRPLLNCNTES